MKIVNPLVSESHQQRIENIVMEFLSSEEYSAVKVRGGLCFLCMRPVEEGTLFSSGLDSYRLDKGCIQKYNSDTIKRNFERTQSTTFPASC